MTIDISNLITATNFNTTRGFIADPLANKITELTGYHWQMYTPSSGCMANVFPAMHNFFFHNWIGLVTALIMLIVLGEVFFYRDVKKQKVGFNITTNEFITQKKLLAYVKSFFAWVWILLMTPIAGVVISVILLNLPIVLMVLIACLFYFSIVILGILLFLKIIITINRKLFSHLIKKETEEEYETRQAQYQFRDGSIVKIKPNITKEIEVEGHHAPGYIRDLSKAQGTYIIKNHSESSGKARLKDSKDSSPVGPPIRECFLVSVNEQDKNKFLKEQEEYMLKERNGFWGKLNTWVFGV